MFLSLCVHCNLKVLLCQGTKTPKMNRTKPLVNKIIFRKRRLKIAGKRDQSGRKRSGPAERSGLRG